MIKSFILSHKFPKAHLIFSFNGWLSWIRTLTRGKAFPDPKTLYSYSFKTFSWKNHIKGGGENIYILDGRWSRSFAHMKQPQGWNINNSWIRNWNKMVYISKKMYIHEAISSSSIEDVQLFTKFFQSLYIFLFFLSPFHSESGTIAFGYFHFV